MSKIYDEFKMPSAHHRGKPFWSWNGKLEKEELLRQVDVMKEMGFGGYFMHSRTGLVTEYLGKEWFELVNAVADKGKEVGMENWLYDEDRWPSGSAGGYVTMDPKNSMKFIRMEKYAADEYVFEDKHFITFACDLLPDVHEFAFTNDAIITKDTPKSDYEGKTVLAFSIEIQEKDPVYNGYTYVDTMDPDAIKAFIDITHEKYAENCGDRIGTSISGIFTDEPHRGAVMCGFSAGNRDPFYITPYTPALFDKFLEKFGYDLKEKLIDLFMLRDGAMISQVKHHYVDLCEDLFIESFAKQINDWCNDRNMILTGHVLHEDSFTTQVSMIGSIMRFYEFMGTPGVDVLSEFNRGYWIVKQLDSVGRQMGKEQLLSELYGCTGWQMDFESHKWVGGWQALFGINLRCPHLSWYSMQGEAKRDYPASILHQSAWYKDYGVVEDYFSRLHVALSGKPVCDTLVVNPVESVFGMIYPGWSRHLGTAHPEVAKLEGMYTTQFQWLASSQLDFDYGDEEMMSRHCSVVVEDGTPYIKFGCVKYKKVLISGMRLMRKTTLDLISEFAAAGGQVIVAGFGPDHIDALPSDAFAKAQTSFKTVEFDKDAIVNALTEKDGRVVKVSDCMGNSMADIFCQIKHDDEGYSVVLMNMNKETTYYGCKVVINLDGDCEEWDANDGTRALLTSSNNGVIEIVTDFYACGERIYRIVEKSELARKPEYSKFASYALPEEYDIELDEENVLVLDTVQAYADGEQVGRPVEEILKADICIRDKYGLPRRGGSMMQPWFLGLTEQNKYGRIALDYKFTAEYIPEKFGFVCETPDLWDITINGQALDRSKENGVWIDEAFHKFDLCGCMLKQGENVIHMEADMYQTLNLEAVYIIGDFGVALDHQDKKMTAPVKHIVHGDIASKGLPFYSGAITYKTKINFNKSVGYRAFIELPDFEAALVKVSANGCDERAIAWQPYEADITDMLVDGDNEIRIKYVLTRRNTFGPLHMTPSRLSHYGPDHFISRGNEWIDDYVFVPAGMTAVPNIVLKK